MKLPKCCGVDMKLHLETARFLEVECINCRDVVYIKKTDASIKPQMLDD